jgi:GMP synthase (glutamine-hydrolysing)
MFSACLKKEGEGEWKVINIASDEALPDDILSYKGIVITGSHFNTRDRDTLPWFEPMCIMIRKAAETGSPRIYGGCFGCQLIAFALGGEVDYNPEKQFALKAEKLQLFQPMFTSLLCDCNISCCCESPTSTTNNLDSLNVIVSHGECVTKLPPCAQLVATSDSCVNEIFICGEKKNIICCQSHPEFCDSAMVKYAIYDRIAPVVIEERKRLTEDQATEAMTSFEQFAKEDGKDAKYFMSLVSDFLHK